MKNMNAHNSHKKNTAVSWVFVVTLFTMGFSVFSYAQERYYVQERYIELGKQPSISSFYQKQATEVTKGFRIPIFDKRKYENKAVTWQPQRSASTTSSLKTRKRKSRTRLRLEARLKNLKIIPMPKYQFGKEGTIGRKELRWEPKNYINIKSYKLKIKKVPNLLKDISKLAKVDVKSALNKQLNLKAPNPTIVAIADMDRVQFFPESINSFELLKLHLQEPKDLDLLTVDILFQEKDSCEEVTPLTEYLKDKETKDFRIEYYKGMCLHRNKMYTESIPLLAEVIGKSTEYYAKGAVSEIIRDLPKGYESIISEGLAPKKVYNRLDQEQKDKYNYILSKGYFTNENYKRAEVHSKIVSEKSSYYYEAQFLMAISQYMSGNLSKGTQTITKLKDKYLKKFNVSEDLKSLIHITLARFLFERGAYNKAIREYSQVSRSHPLWVDSLIEKGWAQIQIGDYKGAVGNMFTLKSPFFKDAYIPEAQVIQTIGYLNICQFADADETLAYLEKNYPREKKSISDYKKSGISYYDTLTSYITQDTSKIYEYRGLSTSMVREMGRDREYLDAQQKLNNIVDEVYRFNTFIQKLMKMAKNLTVSLSNLTQKSEQLREQESKALIKEKVKLAKSLKDERKKIYEKGVSLNYRIAAFNKGIKAFKKANKNAVDRAIKLRDSYLALAEKKLEKSMSKIDSRLDFVLKNSDFIRYEIYINSGKNIRYRTAGGKVQEETDADAERLPSSVIADKNYGWSFKGEFWEDEIGNFRSQLKNLCPKKEN